MEENVVKRTIRISLLCLAVFVSLTALAAEKNGIVTSKDGMITIAPKAGNRTDTRLLPPPGQSFIYNDISSYPLGRYWCCTGYTISGPTSVIGQTFADGMPFTPAANMTVTEVVVAVGYVTGTNAVTVTLNDDDNGLPGTAIATFQATNLPGFGGCCTYSIKQLPGVSVTGGTQYWIVVQPGANDTWAAWTENDTNETLQPFAFYSSQNGGWTATEGDIAAYAILGH